MQKIKYIEWNKKIYQVPNINLIENKKSKSINLS